MFCLFVVNVIIDFIYTGENKCAFLCVFCETDLIIKLWPMLAFIVDIESKEINCTTLSSESFP